MLTRVLFLLLITVLALPTAVVTPPQESSQDAWGAISVEAKKKRKNGNKPKFRTITRTFSNPATITIPASGTADLYPSVIEVSGFANGRILDVNLTLHRINHNDPEDLNVLLAAAHLPDRNATVMSDVGDDDDAVDLTLTLDDQAAEPIPNNAGPLPSGTFRPTNDGSEVDVFPPPAPTPNGTAALSAFNSGNPNGPWQLFVDDGNVDSGNFAGGWSLEITAKVKKDKKKGGKKGRR